MYFGIGFLAAKNLDGISIRSICLPQATSEIEIPAVEAYKEYFFIVFDERLWKG